MIVECGSFLGSVGDCLGTGGERVLGGGGLEVHLDKKLFSSGVSLLNNLFSSSEELAMMSDLTEGTIRAGDALTESCKTFYFRNNFHFIVDTNLEGWLQIDFG